MTMDIERELGIEATADKAAIRRAYARRLKETHPEDDPEGFQRLREAYEAALNYAQYRAEEEAEGEGGGGEEARLDAGEEARPHGVINRQPGNRDAEPASRETPDPGPANEEAPAPEPGPKIDGDRAALAGMLQRLAHLLDQGDEETAMNALNAALDDPLLLNLNNRRRFELWLLEEIGEREPLPWAVAKAAIEAFHWDQQWTNLPEDYQYLADRLMTVPLTEERLAELRRDAKKFWTMSYDPTAAGLLLGPYRPIRFSMSTGADIMDAMTQLLQELRDHYPAILQNHVDPRVLAWWSDATENRMARVDKRSRWIIWIVVGASAALGLTQVLLKHM